MSNLNYSVSETIHRREGRIVEIVYDYEETQEEEVERNMQKKTEKHDRHYEASIKLSEYERLAKQSSIGALSFDDFVRVLRPFMMGTYAGGEVQEAFRLLDKDASGTIDIDELAAFLPVIHPHATKDTLLNYVNKVDTNADRKLDFGEFNDMILRGVGRDIVCGNI